MENVVEFGKGHNDGKSRPHDIEWSDGADSGIGRKNERKERRG